ncbi:hypothetical protein FRC08_000893 [Ceratobasidium sp. 394]|nr:hypothetical protein FRC08_000893 [Ceratobasidium sp. 394]
MLALVQPRPRAELELRTVSVPRPGAIPDSLSFPQAATVPTSFVTASIALALDLGLKYPDPPARSPLKSAANVWATAMASLKGGPEFGFDLEDGVVQGGSWYPSESAMNKYANCQGINGPTAPSHLPTVPSSTQNMPERERKRLLEVGRPRVVDRTFRLSADDNGLAPIPASYAPAFTVPRYSASTRALEPIELADPWDNVHPMSWGTGDLSREAMDRRLGSGWNGGAPRFTEVEAPRLIEIIEGSSTSGSTTSTSSGMGRSGSDESYTSIDEAYSSLKRKASARRGSEPSTLRGSEPALLRRGSGSGSGSGLTRGTAPRANANGSANTRTRGSTSPFRVPASVSLRRHGSPPYTYRARVPSPVLSGESSVRPVSAGATVPVPAPRPMSALEELIYHGHSATPVRPVVYAMDEPILVWGGATSTPMPDGVELRMTKFGKCHDFDGKDVASATFGREKMWPLLGEMLRAGEYVFPEMVHLRGGMQACATSAVGMMSRGENVGKRLVFDVPGS